LKRTLTRLLIVALSVGWIVPLTMSFWAIYAFIWEVILPVVNQRQVPGLPWHPFDLADEFFYFSMAWLALAIPGWTLHLTRDKR
jgi:hypothetical protein